MFVKLNENNDILASASFKPDETFIETENNIVRGYDGKLYFEGQEPQKPLTEVQQKKIQQLKNNCYNFIIEKYPLFKQINLVNGVGTLQEKSEYDNFIAIQRSLCNAKEQEILNASTVEEINNINIEF